MIVASVVFGGVWVGVKYAFREREAKREETLLTTLEMQPQIFGNQQKLRGVISLDLESNEVRVGAGFKKSGKEVWRRDKIDKNNLVRKKALKVVRDENNEFKTVDVEEDEIVNPHLKTHGIV